MKQKCEGKCIRGIKGEPVSIGRLERFVADYHLAHSNDDVEKPESNGIKMVAVIVAWYAILWEFQMFIYSEILSSHICGKTNCINHPHIQPPHICRPWTWING